MAPTISQRHPFLKDMFSIIIFVICVFVGTLFINNFVFRSFNVVGPSMETTLFTNDRLIVNRIPVTLAQIQNKSYIPMRGEIIVFKNPNYTEVSGEEYIVKRVIAFEDERVLLEDGKYKVFNNNNPNGFNPDDNFNGEPGSPTSGRVDMVVPKGTIFVSGDHRQGNFSYDSRNGLGTIPYFDIVGPVGIRVYPFDKIRLF